MNRKNAIRMLCAALSLSTAGTTVLPMISTVVLAAESIEVDGTKTTLAAAITEANQTKDKVTIKLQKDVEPNEVTTPFKVENDLVLNLNGHKITTSTKQAIEVTGSLTVIDDSAELKGSIISTKADHGDEHDHSALIDVKGSFTLESGNLVSKNSALNVQGVASIKGGKLTGDGNTESADKTDRYCQLIWVNGEKARLDISGGDINCGTGLANDPTMDGITVVQGELNISGGTISGTMANNDTDPDYGETDDLIWVYGANCILNISGGQIINNGAKKASVIYIEDGAQANIKKGQEGEEPVISAPNAVDGSYGIGVYVDESAGKVSISDGTITGSGNGHAVGVFEAGAKDTPALKDEQGDSLEISGGTFKIGKAEAEADLTANKYTIPSMAVNSEGEVKELTNTVLAFGYGETKEEAVKELKTQLKLTEDDPESKWAEVERKITASVWGDQVMFIYFKDPIPQYKNIGFTVTNSDNKASFKDAIYAKDEDVKLISWSFLNQKQTPNIGNVSGKWKLTFDGDPAPNITFEGPVDTTSIKSLKETEESLQPKFAVLTDNPVEDDNKQMTATPSSDNTIGQYYEVEFNTKQLPKTEPSNSIDDSPTDSAYYLGWALQKPEQKEDEPEITQFSIATSEDGVKLLEEEETVHQVEPNVVGENEGVAVYYDASKDNEGNAAKRWVKITWLDASKNPQGTTIIHTTFKDITFKVDGSEAVIAKENTGFNHDKTKAFDLIKGAYEKVSDKEKTKNDVIDNTMWAAFTLTPSANGSTEYKGRVSKDGVVLYTDTETGKPGKGGILYYSLNDQLNTKDNANKEGNYRIELLQNVNGNFLSVAETEIPVYKVIFEAEHGKIDSAETVYVGSLDEAKELTPPAVSDLDEKYTFADEWDYADPDDSNYTITVTAKFEEKQTENPGTGQNPGSQTTKPGSTEEPGDTEDENKPVQNADGSQTVTSTDENGNEVKETTGFPASSGKEKEVVTTDKTSGDVKTETTQTDGTVSTVTEKKDNSVEASVTVSDQALSSSQQNSTPVQVIMPTIPADHSGSDVQVEVKLPEAASGTITQVEIPVVNENPGSVACYIDENGNEVLIPESNAKNGVISIPLDGSARIVIKDASKSFTDLGSNYDKKTYPGSGVAYTSARGIMNGQGDGSFDLDGVVTRGMIARILYNLEGSPDVSGKQVPAGVNVDWYRDAATWAASSGLMAQGSNFRGDDDLTREQLAMVLWRYEGKLSTPSSDLAGYSESDKASISTSEMENAVKWAVGSKILGQGSPINGQGEGKRGEIANMLYRFLANVSDGSNF